MQNEINVTITPAQLQAINEALTALENIILTFPVPDPKTKSKLVKAPDDARHWEQIVLFHAQQNINKLSRDFDPALVQTDIAFADATLATGLRMKRIMAHLAESQFLAESDIFAAMLEARRHLLNAKIPGLDKQLDEGMESFFSRPKKTKTTPPAA